MSFNPVLGFRPAATHPIDHSLRPDTAVSIPCWVFVPLRRKAPFAAERIVPFCFNPVLGFRPAATAESSPGLQFDSEVSIPCWVFVPLRLNVGRQWRSRVLTVSIPCWVFVPLRRREPIQQCRGHRFVSIPCWVFVPLRLRNLIGPTTRDGPFQSRAGFSSRCDQR